MPQPPTSTICGVYEIRCQSNGRIYVGSSTDVGVRFLTHRTRLRAGKHDNAHLQRAWDKYGEEDFVFEVVGTCNPDETYDQEQKRFGLYPWKKLFNIARDAHRGAGRWGRLGHTNSPEHRAKISAALKGRTVWNTGPGTNTWADRAAETRVDKYEFEIVAEHLDGRVERFSHEAAAARHFGYKRKRINENMRRGGRLTTGWAFRKVAKEVDHPDLRVPM